MLLFIGIHKMILKRVLIVDDDSKSRDAVANFMQLAHGYEICQCADGEEALKLYEKDPFPVVITDIRMPKMSGLELLKQIRSLPAGNKTAVILATGFADTKSAIEALREGAFDYLKKPVNPITLSAVLNRLTEENCDEIHPEKEDMIINTDRVDHKENSRRLHDQCNVVNVRGYGEIGVFSDEMRHAVDLAYRFHQDRSIPVLIEGATGTGKEALARLVHFGHQEGDFDQELNPTPFVSINCPAITPSLFESELFGYEPGAFTGAMQSGGKGKLELAQEGTLFLDEIGDLPLDMQPKLLRALQEKEIFRVGGTKCIKLNVRVIVATNYNLKDLMEKGGFRRDLYHRLNLGTISLPPLAQRKEEIIPLAQMFLLNFAQDKRRRFSFITSEACQILEDFLWTGNVRELRNTIERVVLLYDEVSLRPSHLSFLSPDTPELVLDDTGLLRPGEFKLPEDSFNLKELNNEIIRKAVKKFKGNKSRAASYLQIARNTLKGHLKSK